MRGTALQPLHSTVGEGSLGDKMRLIGLYYISKCSRYTEI